MKKIYLTLRGKLAEPKETGVYPVVMLVEGVHHAINGRPAYYPAQSLAIGVEEWEGAPVVIGHPQDAKGNYVSARTPGVMSLGSVSGAKVEGGRLLAHVNVTDPPDGIENMEISTGVHVEMRDEEGIWNGESYEKVIERIYPDHLALLPDQEGACSRQDGCGIRAHAGGRVAFKHNSETKDDEPKWGEVDKKELPSLAYADEEGMKYPHHWISDGNMYLHRGGLMAAWSAANGARSGQKASEEVIAHLTEHRDALGLTANELSFDDAAREVWEAMGPKDAGYMVDAFPTKIVYSTESGMFAQSYERTPEGVKIVGQPVAVKKRVDYVPMQGCCPDKIADVIQANQKLGPEDAEWLMELGPERIEKLGGKMQTLQEFIASAPEHLLPLLTNAVNDAQRVRDDLIAVIVANQVSGLTAEQLSGVGTEVLRGMAKMAAEPQSPPVYTLAAGNPPVAATNDEEPLVMSGLVLGGAK